MFGNCTGVLAEALIGSKDGFVFKMQPSEVCAGLLTKEKGISNKLEGKPYHLP